jgi:hypothetical protein
MRAATVSGAARTVKGTVRTVGETVGVTFGVTVGGNAALGNERKPKRT